MTHCQLKILNVNTQIVMRDRDDMRLLGEFLIAMANTNVDALGAYGGARIEFHRQDYQAKFENAAILRRQHRGDTELSRHQKCSVCSDRFCSTDIKQKLCEFHLDAACIA